MDKTNLSDKRSLVLLRKLEGSWDATRGTLLGAGTNVCLDLGGVYMHVYICKNLVNRVLDTSALTVGISYLNLIRRGKRTHLRN